MSPLRRMLPRGLFGRAALILIVPIVTIQLVVSTAFIQRHYNGVTRQMTQGVAIDLGFLLSEVERGSSVEEARLFAARVAEPLQLTVTLPAGPDAPTEDASDFIDLSGKVVIETLREQLPGLIAADMTDEERIVNLSFKTSKGPLQVQLSRRRMSATNPHQLLVLMIFTSLLMTLIAYLFLRNQLRPIARLAQASEAFGKGQTQPYRP
ncbi:MAG: two-component sensor histidine kinase, partial [Tabrizicola sp.]|nr:two-component sensor histidine kinase [Tabrizicola sp.]